MSLLLIGAVWVLLAAAVALVVARMIRSAEDGCDAGAAAALQQPVEQAEATAGCGRRLPAPPRLPGPAAAGAPVAAGPSPLTGGAQASGSVPGA